MELGYSGNICVDNSYELVITTRYISQSICAAVISAIAFIMILIALVIISSNVINYIKENMPSLGVLKAIGYKSSQLISSQILQFSCIVFVASVVGIGISYTVFPYLADMMNQQTGVPYAVKFLPLPCIITIAFIVGAVALVVFLSAGGIKKLEPITALRQGISTHNFKKNHISLNKTKMLPNVALSMKTMFSGVKQNVIICVTMLVLSLCLVFVGTMLKNVIVNIDPMIDLVMGEVPDYIVAVNKQDEKEFLRDIKNESCIEKVYQFSMDTVQHNNGSELWGYFSDDFSKINNQNYIVEGRFPKYGNEIAIGAKYAKDNNLKIRDEITILYEGKSFTYLITGYTQLANSLGEDCLMTNEAFEKIAYSYVISNYIDVKDKTDIDTFDNEICKRFGEKIIFTHKTRTHINDELSVYVSLITTIVTVILVLSALIIIFVMYLLVKMLLNNKKQDYGILKALGYTTKQLVVQTALSFMPPMIISTAVGIVISPFIIKPLFALLLNGIGVVKCTFEVWTLFNIIAGTGLILFTFVITCLLSLQIKKIAPRDLLSGE